MKEWVAAIQGAVSQSLNSQVSIHNLGDREGFALLNHLPSRVQDLEPIPSARSRKGSEILGHEERKSSVFSNENEQLRYLNILRSVPGNGRCADCKAKGGPSFCSCASFQISSGLLSLVSLV